MADRKQAAVATHRPVSRRRFLKVIGSLAGGSLIGRATGGEPHENLPMRVGRSASRVLQVHAPYVVAGPSVHRVLLGQMLERALTSLTNAPTVADAWTTLLDPQDVIGLKFNTVGQESIGTTDATADAIIESLLKSGFRAEQIVCIEGPENVARRHGTTPRKGGYEPAPTDFGSGADQFASVLRQVTALIDIPYLKSHNLARMSCALKNLAYGLIKHPARYHGNGCSPYIADIVATDLIRSRLRLCVVDALRVMYDGGPDSTAETVSDEGMLLVSTDPVATDTVALGYLNEIRERFRLTPVARSVEEVKYLAEAHRRGLGVAVWHGIDLVRAEL